MSITYLDLPKQELLIQEHPIQELRFRPIPIEPEPKRNNRFTFKFPEEFEIEPFLVNEFTWPTIKKGLFFNTWNDMEVKILDIIGPSTTRLLHKMKDRKNFTIEIYGLDPCGIEVEKWEIYIKKFKSIDFGGKGSYADDFLKEIKVVLKVKKCILL